MANRWTYAIPSQTDSAGRLPIWEPPIGIEPMTYALREACSPASDALAAPIARAIARMALATLGLSGDPVHESVHARDTLHPASCYCA